MKQPKKNEFKRIEIEVLVSSEEGQYRKMQAFMGRILVDTGRKEVERFLVAETARGKLAVYFENINGAAILEVFDSFEDLKRTSDDLKMDLNGGNGSLPEDVMSVVADSLGAVEDLDI